MIKTENSSKFSKNPRNSPKNPKNPKNLPPSFTRRMEGYGLAGQGGFAIFSMTWGFWLTPLWPCLRNGLHILRMSVILRGLAKSIGSRAEMCKVYRS